MYIVLAILIFGILIATHELGHFLTAKLFKVKVNEFAIGMGPAIFKKQRGETLYSLRCLPLGGFCAMEGEDEDTGDERAFSRQSAWKKIIILAAGAFMNFLFGLIIMLIIGSRAVAFVGTTVEGIVDGFKYEENGLQQGDTILKIDGAGIYYSNDFSTYMGRSDGTVDMLVLRDGEKVLLKDYALKPEIYVEDGVERYRYGIDFGLIEATGAEKIRYAFISSWNFVRMVGLGLSDLFSGAVGVDEMSGVVGIVDTMNQLGEAAPTTSDGIFSIAYLGAFIAVNLAVMNLLPIPALDGGRIFFTVVRAAVEKITRKKIDSKYEAYINGAALLLLIGLMIYVMFNDVLRIASR